MGNVNRSGSGTVEENEVHETEVDALEVDQKEGPRTYVVTIGIDEYQGLLGFDDLESACHDAECLARAFEYRAERSKRKLVVIPPLLDASAQEIKETLKDVVRQLTKNSVLLVFFSGHAMAIPDRWTHIVPSNPQSYEDCIAMESLLQGYVEARSLKYVHVCCFFLACRRTERPKHFRDAPTMVELDESNSYVNVYVCKEGEGVTDWCHAAQSLCFLLYLGDGHELGQLLTRFKEESKFLSLGSVAVEHVPDEIGVTVELFNSHSSQTPYSSQMRYQKIMEQSQLDCLIKHAPILRVILNGLSDKSLTKVATPEEIDNVRCSLRTIAKLLERLVEKKRFEVIASEMKLFHASDMQEIEERLREMLTLESFPPQHLEDEDKDNHRCKIPSGVLQVIRDQIKQTSVADFESSLGELKAILEMLNASYSTFTVETAGARRELLESHVAAFHVPDVNLNSLPNSEDFQRRLVDHLWNLCRDTPFANLPDGINDVIVTTGCLWLIFVKTSPFSSEQVSHLQQGLAKIVSAYKKSAPVFAFAKEPKHRSWRVLPARVQNLAMLGKWTALKHEAASPKDSDTLPTHPPVPSTKHMFSVTKDARVEDVEATAAASAIHTLQGSLEHQLLKLQHQYREDVSAEIASITLHDLGQESLVAADLEQIKHHFNESLQMKRSFHGDRDHPDIAAALAASGQVSLLAGDVEQAKQYFDESLQIHRSLHGYRDHPDIAAALAALGHVSLTAGDVEQAKQYFGLSLQMKRSLHVDRDHADIAAALAALGHVSLTAGDLKQAKQCFKEFLQMKRSLHGDRDHPDIASAPTALGQKSVAGGDLESGNCYFRKSLDRDHAEGVPKCICLKASELRSRLRKISGKSLQILERGIEQSHCWLSSAKDLHFIVQEDTYSRLWLANLSQAVKIHVSRQKT